MVASRYQTEMCAATFTCCEGWPSPHHTSRYHAGSGGALSTLMDQSHVGTSAAAPCRTVVTAMIAAVMAPNMTRGMEPTYVRSRLAMYMVAKKFTTPMSV